MQSLQPNCISPFSILPLHFFYWIGFESCLIPESLFVRRPKMFTSDPKIPFGVVLCLYETCFTSNINFATSLGMASTVISVKKCSCRTIFNICISFFLSPNLLLVYWWAHWLSTCQPCEASVSNRCEVITSPLSHHPSLQLSLSELRRLEIKCSEALDSW